MIKNKKAISLILTICLFFASVGVFADDDNINVGQADNNSLDGLLNALKQGANALVEVLTNRFSDLNGHWALEFIAALMDMGSINGYTDGTFRPNGDITRAEFTKIMVTSLGSDPGNSSAGHWAMNYINEAIDNEYVKVGEFDNLNKAISRAEMARMISRALDEEPQNIDKLKSQITDFDQIDREYMNHIARVYAAGIITGYPDGSFKPNGTATRAEASTMLMRLLDPDKRKVPEVQKGNVIVINGEEVPVARKDTVEVFNKALKVLKNGSKHTLLTYNGDDTVTVSYVPSSGSDIFEQIMCFYSETKRQNPGEFDNAIVIYEHTDETKGLAKEILKEIYPTGYKKIYEEFESVIYKGTEKSGKADGRVYTVKSFPSSTTIFIGGK